MRFQTTFLGLVLALGGLAASGCGDDGAADPITTALAEQCGIDVQCDAGGLAEGNAAISGVPSIDAFFSAVLNFQVKADAVSAGIEGELRAIRGDFGIDADANLATELEAQIAANVDGGLSIEAEPARCEADVSATLDAKARCEGDVDTGSVEVECQGACEVEASADVSCEGEADLKCTANAPSIECEGQCQGSCEVELDAAAECSGTCRGSCSGECSAYSDSGMTQCAGECDGMCEGSCETKLAVAAECMGECTGECTVTNPDAGCEGGIRAACEAEGDASVMCEGRCTGEVNPPSANVECEASVKAEAQMNVECTPPRIRIDYELNADVDAEAQARFVAAIENLRVRLPALLASIERGRLVIDAGEGLITEAEGALEAGIDSAEDAAAEGNLRVIFGLSCAVQEAGNVGNVLSSSAGDLQASYSAAADVSGALGLD